MKNNMDTTTRSEMPNSNGKSSLNPDALNQLLGQMINDLGAAVNGALVVLGDGRGPLLEEFDKRGARFRSRVLTFAP
jgi:hypothetical protein